MRIDIHDAKAFLKEKEMKKAADGGNFFTYQNNSFRVQCTHKENYITFVDVFRLRKNQTTNRTFAEPIGKNEFLDSDTFKNEITEFISKHALDYFEDFYDETILLNGFSMQKISFGDKKNVLYLSSKHNIL